MQALINQLAQAGIKATFARSQFNGVMHRLKVAKNDVCYYQKQLDAALDDVANADEAYSDAWLSVINSGLSHRRVLQLARLAR
ncbi:hypothetical protein [Methylomonas sp. 11b]|uniref:hypothetical protein n=1 Tax=Methylomonas sp. 11b TaxID=1168169 RepID=UPI00047AB14A|nr:hypothetical protein [Methylomonas sp. 11b]